MIELVGFIAAFCTTAAFIPQAVKVYKSRSTKDISIGMFILLTTGLVCWLIYGILITSFPIIAANIITLIFAGFILYMKIKLDFTGKSR
jgi:MtN3 and saliva related transmembrane protein